jgi:thiamine biosynthesis lipoprotein
MFSLRNSVLFLLILSFLSCSEKGASSYQKIQGMAFGTTFHITMKPGHSEIAEKHLDSLIHTVNQSLSTYMPDSDISRINSGDTTVILDPYFIEVFQKSGKIYSDSEGAFDPTIGIMVNAWGFGPVEAIPDLDESKVDSLMESVGFDKLKLDQGKLIRSHPLTYLDFNANAKGYGVDVIGRFLESKGVTDYLVEIGGEIRARGKNAKGLPWKVAIEKPNFDGSRSFQAIIELKDESIATSGNYRKFKVDSITGEKYAHTIDSRSGYPSKSDLLSASVIGSMDCADADGYATAFMAMGSEKTRAFLETHEQMKAFLIYSDNDGEIKTYKTDNLKLVEN